MLTGILGVPDDDADRLFDWADQIVYHADPDYSAAVIDAVDTDPYRLLPFRSPVSERVFELRRTPHHGPRPAPGRRRHLGARRRSGRRRTADGTRARHVLPAAPDRRQRDDEALALAGADRLRRTPRRARAAARRPGVARPGRRGGAPLGEPTGALPPHRDHRHADSPVYRSPPATRSSRGTWRPTSTRRSSPIRTVSTSDARPNRHVTFGGGGPHLCLGQWMARLEVRVFLEALVRRVDRPRARRTGRAGAQQLHQRCEAAPDQLANTLTALLRA